MTIPETNFAPAFNITRASHVVLSSTDLPACRDFYTEVVGLLVTEETPDAIYFRGVEEICHHSLVIRKASGAVGVRKVGMRVFMEEDLDRAAAHFQRTNVPFNWAEVPFQGRTIHFTDSEGTQVELCASMNTLPRVYTKTHLHKGAAALRMDHYQVLVPNARRGAKFYADLGFRISDYMVVEEGDENLLAVFLYRKNNPWDIVLVEDRGPRMHHFGYVVESMDKLIRGLDIAGNIDFPNAVEAGPGRHVDPHSYYCYLRDPSGHRVELLLPGIQLIDMDELPNRCVIGGKNDYAWGMPFPKSWMEEASSFV